MDDCVFCKITQGRLPCHKIYEDGLFFAFLDHRPLNPGNALLIPKKHYRWVDDVEEYGVYWETARQIGRVIMTALGAGSINYLTIGEEVPHAHIRIIPRYATETTPPFRIFPKETTQEELVRIATKIYEKLA